MKHLMGMVAGPKFLRIREKYIFRLINTVV